MRRLRVAKGAPIRTKESRLSARGLIWLNLLAALGNLMAGVGAALAVYYAASQMKMTDRSVSRQLRAYVVPSLNKDMEVGKDGLVADIAVLNTGQTPAHIISLKGALSAQPPDDSLNLLHDMETGPQLGAGQSFSIAISDTSHTFDELIGKINKARLTDLFAFGRIEYTDIFAEIHVTQFCYRFHFVKEDDVTNEASAHLTPCTMWNDAS